MANFEVSSKPEYTEQIRKFETKDPAHADLFNAVIGALLNNDVFLKLAIDAAFRQGTWYTDQQIADLINGAPETLDTLGEIAEAMKNNSDVVDALNAAIGTKASQAEIDGHIGNGTIHITASERQTWNDNQTKTGDVQDNTVTFESGDNGNPTGWSDVALVTTKEKMNSLMRKLSLTVKNMRYLWKLMGTTQLSIGDGTVTGAINALNTGMAGKAASSHTHSKSQITDFPGALPASDVYAWAKAASKPGYNWDEIGNKPGRYPPSAHTHDDRYYTEAEVDSKLSELIKIKKLTLTTAYSSANTVQTSTYHGLGNRIIGSVAQAKDGGGIRSFPYYLSTITNDSVIQVTAFSASQWTSANGGITIDVLLFYT